MSAPTRLGYLKQLYAIAGWTSAFPAHHLLQPTLIMVGDDDPIIPTSNARTFNALISNSEIRVFDSRHVFLLTRLTRSIDFLEQFLAPATGLPG